MPSEVAKNYSMKTFALPGENVGLPLQAGEVAWSKPETDWRSPLIVFMSIIILIGGLALIAG